MLFRLNNSSFSRLISIRRYSDYDRLEQVILQNTIRTSGIFVPEIALQLITPELKSYHESYSNHNAEKLGPEPFWAFFWPGGQVLTRYILDFSSVFSGKRVFDLGSGCGASAIAALSAGAAKPVLSNDIDRMALAATSINARQNGFNPSSDLTLSGDNFLEA